MIAEDASHSLPAQVLLETASGLAGDHGESNAERLCTLDFSDIERYDPIRTHGASKIFLEKIVSVTVQIDDLASIEDLSVRLSYFGDENSPA